MAERPHLVVLDLLETYARERDIDVRLERRHELNAWSCTLVEKGKAPVVTTGSSAREAIRRALLAAGVTIPGV
jgi:hypothetical protein